MYLTPDMIAALEAQYGTPEQRTVEAVFNPREFGLLEMCARTRRAHDVTLMVRGADGRFALIRKPSYRPEVFRPPSGGIEPGEAFEVGAVREALEETGLRVRLERYLLRVVAQFSCGERITPWTTHVFAAGVIGGELQPIDRKEIAEARWATAEEMCCRYRPLMLAMGTAGMRYRVELQDAALRLLGLGPGFGEHQWE